MRPPRMGFAELEFLQEEVQWEAHVTVSGDLEYQVEYLNNAPRPYRPARTSRCELTGRVHVKLDVPNQEAVKAQLRRVSGVVKFLTDAAPAAVKFGPVEAVLRRCDTPGFCFRRAGVHGPAMPGVEDYVVTCDEAGVGGWLEDVSEIGTGWVMFKFQAVAVGPFKIHPFEDPNRVVVFN